MEIAEKVEKLRKDYPDMFSHPELKAGEVWIGDFLIDFLIPHVGILASDGFSSVRVGKTETFREVNSFSYEYGIGRIEKKVKASCKPLFALAEEAVQFLKI